MTPSLSAALFSALLTSTSPTEGSSLQNGKLFPVNRVKDSIEQCMRVWEWMNVNDSYEILRKNLEDFWLVSVLESVSRASPSYSEYELYVIATPVIEQSIYDIQSQIEKDKGFFQISKEHWQELLDISEDETKGWEERLVAVIRMIAIINFFSLLPAVYSMTIYNTYKGKRIPSALFGWFAVSNGLGAVWLLLAQTPLEWAGYSIATISAVITFFLLRHNEKNNLLDDSFMEHMKQHTAFSVYDLVEGKALFLSPKLLEILGTTKEKAFSYQKEHGEVVTLWYPDIEERERIAAYQSEHTEKWQEYEATFFPRRVDNGKKIALHFNTIPRKDKKGKVIGTYRFAEDVTRDYRDNIDLLTGASDKKGFEKRFHDILTKKKIRWADKIQTWLLSIIYSDLDSFKSINDTYNHDNADVVLKEFANMARRHFREEDLIARFGWDEFGIICDNSHKEVILLKFNNLRDEFSRSTFEIVSGRLVENGLILHDSYEEALRFKENKNLEIKRDMEAKWEIYNRFAHCCIGGVGVTWGVTDFTYEADFSEEWDTHQKLIILKNQAERVMNLIKYLEFLGMEGVNISKNGVGMPIFDTHWQEIIGADIYNRIGKVSVDRETLIRAPELIAEGVKRATKNR